MYCKINSYIVPVIRGNIYISSLLLLFIGLAPLLHFLTPKWLTDYLQSKFIQALLILFIIHILRIHAKKHKIILNKFILPMRFNFHNHIVRTQLFWYRNYFTFIHTGCILKCNCTTLYLCFMDTTPIRPYCPIVYVRLQTSTVVLCTTISILF